MDKRDFVLEIGTEELPPAVVEDAQRQLHRHALIDALIKDTELGLDISQCHVYTTPRRIIIHIEDLPYFYKKIKVGPPKRIAYNKEGKSTGALQGFLKKVEATEKDIAKIPENDNEKVTVSKEISIKNLIAERIIRFIKFFEGFKTMVWESEKALKFPRPIRWILSLLGDEIIPLEIGDIKAGNITYGGCLFPSEPIKVKNAQELFKKLKKNHIIYDFKQRKRQIHKYLANKQWYKNEQLLNEVTGLVEYPDFIEGRFNKEYLKLPKEVLIASMSKNQRIFPLQDKDEKLINRFVGIINGRLKQKKRIRLHYEQVLDARLKDALFFYNEDLKIPLSERAKQLEAVIFHKKLGSYTDKVERLKQLISSFKDAFRLNDTDYEKLVKASQLCKADLLTQMVGEFPSLQGVMGKYYALAEGIDKETAQAIEGHYRPRFSDDKLPETVLGAILALLDKFDSIICHFKAGNQPKANWDLYALRRQSIGIINIILDKKMQISLSEIFDRVFALSPGSADENSLKNEFMEFFKERIVVIMKEDYKFRHDLIDAVISSGFDDIYNFYLRLDTLNNIIGEFYFEQARVVVERTNNIIKNIKEFILSIDASLLKEAEEKYLYEKFLPVKEKMTALADESNYSEATKVYAEVFYDIIHKFFDKVMVNVEDAKLRNNRLKLLKEINELYVDNIADLSKVRC